MKEYQLTEWALKVLKYFPRLGIKEARRIAEKHLAPHRSANVVGAHGQTEQQVVMRLVAAHARHERTGYDGLFALGYTKAEARHAVGRDVRLQLQAWR